MSEPRTVAATFHLTHACNLRCTYCYTGEKVGRHMSSETARKAVRFALAEAEAQGAQHLDIVFFGGEPLLRADTLLDVCRWAREEAPAGLRVSFKLSTGGLALTEELMRRLCAAEVYVAISIDGHPAIQDSQRPLPDGRGSSQRITEAAELLLRHNPCANVTSVTTPESAGQLDESVAWLAKTGFSYITTTFDYSSPWSRQHIDELEIAARRLADWYVAETLDGRLFYLSCFDQRIRTWTRGPLAENDRCSLGRRQFSIAPSGRLYPCVQFVHEDEDHTHAIGHIDSGFDRARRSAVACASEGEKSECGGCSLQERCSSWCACVNYMSTGHVDRASPVLCEVERIFLPLADEVARRLWKRRHAGFLHKHYNPAYPVLSFLEHLAIEEKSHAS